MNDQVEVSHLSRQPRRRGSLILSEAERSRSRENGRLAAGQSCEIGTPLFYADYPSDNLLAPVTAAATPSTQLACCVAAEAADASAGATASVLVMKRDCRLKLQEMRWPPGSTMEQQQNWRSQLSTLGVNLTRD